MKAISGKRHTINQENEKKKWMDVHFKQSTELGFWNSQWGIVPEKQTINTYRILCWKSMLVWRITTTFSHYSTRWSWHLITKFLRIISSSKFVLWKLANVFIGNSFLLQKVKQMPKAKHIQLKFKRSVAILCYVIVDLYENIFIISLCTRRMTEVWIHHYEINHKYGRSLTAIDFYYESFCRWETMNIHLCGHSLNDKDSINRCHHV